MAKGTSKSPPLIDTHAHLDDPKLAKEEASVLARAREAGVACIVSVGADLESSRAAIDLACREDMVRATVGVHPHDAKETTEETWEELAELATHDQVVAVGECGLDYYRDLSPRETQRQVFARHLALAQSLELPVVVHCRDAYEDCLDILQSECSAPVRGVLHCFQGNAAAARRAIELGLLIGLGGSLTFPREAELRHVVAELSSDRIVLETDAPYLTPRPKRGRNEPSYVRFVASRLAQLHGVSQHRVAQATTDNAVRVFGLPRHA